MKNIFLIGGKASSKFKAGRACFLSLPLEVYFEKKGLVLLILILILALIFILCFRYI